LAFVRVTTWRTAYAGIVPEDYLRQLDLIAEARRWSEGLAALAETSRCAYIAVEQPGGRVVGYCIAGPERTGDKDYPAELYALYVLPERQGRGLGQALVKTAAAWLLAQGYERMVIYVLRDNHPARRFYEAIGGTAAREKQVEIGGAPLAEVGYGYKLSVLCAS
jgi:GNAT superfamily N-acetyltransferase